MEECDVFVNGRSNGIGAVRCSPSIVKTGRLHGRDCVGRFRVMGESGVAVGYRPYRLAVRPVDVLIVDDCQVCAGCEGLTKARQNEAGIHPMEAGATYDQPVGPIERRILCSTGNPPDASVGAGGKIATFGDHRGRWFDRVDPLGERGHIARKSSGSCERSWLRKNRTSTRASCSVVYRMPSAVQDHSFAAGHVPAPETPPEPKPSD